MNLQSVEKELLEAARNDERTLPDRVSAVRALAEHDSPETIRVLVAITKQPGVAAELASSAGSSLASICFRRKQDLDELALADMTPDAYLAYDSELAKLLATAPHRIMRRGAAGSGI